jgi:hypothetical protein
VAILRKLEREAHFEIQNPNQSSSVDKTTTGRCPHERATSKQACPPRDRSIHKIGVKVVRVAAARPAAARAATLKRAVAASPPIAIGQEVAACGAANLPTAIAAAELEQPPLGATEQEQSPSLHGHVRSVSASPPLHGCVHSVSASPPLHGCRGEERPERGCQ